MAHPDTVGRVPVDRGAGVGPQRARRRRQQADRRGGRYPRAQGAGAGAGRGRAGRPGGGRGQVAVPGQHEPRDQDADERHPRGAAPAGIRADARGRPPPARRGGKLRADALAAPQRRHRPVAHRGRTAGPDARAARSARGAGKRRRPAAAPGGSQGREARGRGAGPGRVRDG